MPQTSEQTPYHPDLDLIRYQTRDMSPRILTKSEYYNWLDDQELRTGGLSDEGILKAMESGLIKILGLNGDFDIMRYLQFASVDVTLGGDFWFFGQNELSRIVMGGHKEALQSHDMLKYGYKLHGQEMVFHRDRFLLAMTSETLSLSNVILGEFDGRSRAARLGLTSHQTSGGIEPTFTGRIVMELSNQNDLDIGVLVGDSVSTIRFLALSSPTTRTRDTMAVSLSQANGQISPFGYWQPEWTEIQKRAKIRQNAISSYD